MTPTRKTLGRTGLAGIAAVGAVLAGVVVLTLSIGGRDAPEPSLPPAPPVVVPSETASPAPAAEPATRSLTAAPATRGLTVPSEPVAQTYSAYCQTPAGVCVLPSAEPIGSACTCPDGGAGRVIP